MRTRNAAWCVVIGCFGAAAASAVAQEVVLLEGGGTSSILVRTDSAHLPGNGVSAIPVQGLEADESMLSIGGVGPAGHLYGVTQKRLYELDANTGQATAVGPRFQTLAFTTYQLPDLEIDPVSGRGLVLGLNRFGTGANGITATIDTTTGKLLELGAAARPFAYAQGDVGFGTAPNVAAIACAGDVPGPNARTMFALDRSRGALVRVGAVGGLEDESLDLSTISTVAPITGLPADASLQALDVDWAGGGWVVVTTKPDYAAAVYALDLATGVATLKRDTGLGALPLLRDAAVIGSAPSLPPLELDVTKATVKYDFRPTHSAESSITLTGTVPYPTGGGRGMKASVDVDGVVREFTVDARGRGVSGKDVFRFVGKLNAGRLRYELDLKKLDLRGFAGADAATPTQATAITVDLFLDGRAYRTRLDLDYFAGRGGRGLAKTP